MVPHDSRSQHKQENTVAQLIKDVNDDTQIWALKKVKTIHPIVESTVKNLAGLEIIKFIRITGNSIQASSELSGNKLKVPATKPFHPTAAGVHLIYDFEFKTMEFYELNSPAKGWGEKMVNASLQSLPKDWEVALVFDWSNGFWDKMEQKYNHVRWLRI
ncbi:MAG: hypothetical protein AVO34_04980 [Firmicutes bacterium ML8_F2]|jgi:hypothetical protein|nr:MAG: hypothetical protein AVO34_04980 [Firmicutes bacterium ML8_F2]